MLEEPGTLRKEDLLGRVYSYEFHLERFKKVTAEMKEHGLDSIVQTTHRDVYGDGFSLSVNNDGNRTSPRATAIFLDLPAPWQALPHLTRTSTSDEPSPLDPAKPVYICTFSPCIEQAQRTVSALRQHGWIEIDMVEMQHKRIEVKREYTGLEYEGMRGVNAIASNVDQAVSRLQEVERRARDFHIGNVDQANGGSHDRKNMLAGKPQEAQKALFNQGTLIHRSEPELKTHTSYLVFAVLPRDWTEEDERQATNTLKAGAPSQSNVLKSRRQLKREARHQAKLAREDGGQAEEKERDEAADVLNAN
jgi:tRNA (adenine57-N1/adenine58-N1)-methyltransferase